MIKIAATCLNSPAGVSAFLQFGIVFGFAIASYLNMQWLKSYTIVYFSVVMVISFIVIIIRRPWTKFLIGRIDILFCIFFLLAFISAITNWTPSTYYYILLSPVFFITPFALGRIMNDKDLAVFIKLVLMMGVALLILMPIEHHRIGNQSLGSSLNQIFSQSHGVMLAGLLFIPTLLALISRILITDSNNTLRQNLILYLLLGFLIIALIWINSRGSIIAGSISVFLLYLYSSSSRISRKIYTVAFMALFIIIGISNIPALNNKKNISEIGSPVPVFLNEKLEPSHQKNEPILGRKSCESIVNSVTDRWIHYQTAVAIFYEHPIIGVGANRYGEFSCTGPGSFPHSSILQVLAELGLIGFSIYASMLLISLQTVHRYFCTTSDVFKKSVIGWLLAYMSFQLIVSQLYGNYFLSAGIYFVLGIAARVFGDESKKIIGTSE